MSFFYFVLFCVAFLLIQSNTSFSAEDIPQLIAQGEAALARRDYDPLLSIGARIRSENPRNLDAYRFALIYCAATGRETGFYQILEEAKKQGVPALVIDELAIKILYVYNRMPSVQTKLFEYEKDWYKEHARSR